MFKCEFDPDCEIVDIFINMMDAVLKKLLIDDDKHFGIKVSVAEAINNCLQHGKFIGSEKIQLYISWYDDKLVIELNNPISDELNIELRFSTHLPVNLFQERGRGFYLMNKYMDDVTLTKKNNRLHVVMEVKFSKSDEKNNASE